MKALNVMIYGLIFLAANTVKTQEAIKESKLEFRKEYGEIVAFRNGFRYKGRVVEYNSEGKIVSEGQYRDGMRNGEWTVWSYDGKRLISKGNYKHGEKDGAWIESWGDGIYKKGKKNGIWSERLLEDGLKEIGNYKDDKRDGLWTTWRDDSLKVNQGNYIKDQMKGLWTYWFENGQKMAEGTYNGHTEKQKYKIYENTEEPKDGLGRSFSETNSFKLYYYENVGIKEGLWTYWYKNGQKEAEGLFKSDIEMGLWTKWDVKGNVISQKTY